MVSKYLIMNSNNLINLKLVLSPLTGFDSNNCFYNYIKINFLVINQIK